ncbi:MULTISPECIES: nucleoside triphosphate pyrophosphohydrolase family protein [Chryseobacterium]|uniref:Uncharacterized protein n=1 Tax=Chryseobacterium gambrini TaxID=373672 RepID=A0A1N7LFZ7_9FLAO|nr:MULTISPECIES: hypothetical protein [Chryseobacterium]SIS72740.1 hypothetical protein SAMN05421785_102210 [Chryseobacterium gambrini]
MARHEIYLKAIEKWGVRAQYEMAQEEATELALAVRKHIRNNNEESFKNLVEEVADVKIMIEQMEMINPLLGLKVEEMIAKKVNRLEKRVELNDFEAK